MKYLIFFIFLFSSPLYAEDLVSSLYSCTHKSNDLVREVKIIHQDQGCQVTYTKAVGTVNEKTKYLWRAKNSISRTPYSSNSSSSYISIKPLTRFASFFYIMILVVSECCYIQWFINLIITITG